MSTLCPLMILDPLESGISKILDAGILHLLSFGHLLGIYSRNEESKARLCKHY
jgi:hypothetical protein